MLLFDVADCDRECRCHSKLGSLILGYDDPFFPSIGTSRTGRKHVLFAHVATSETAQIDEIERALLASGVECIRNGDIVYPRFVSVRGVPAMVREVAFFTDYGDESVFPWTFIVGKPREQLSDEQVDGNAVDMPIDPRPRRDTNRPDKMSGERTESLAKRPPSPAHLSTVARTSVFDGRADPTPPAPLDTVRE